MMTDEEIKRADRPQLLRHRLALLRRPCEVCDKGYNWADCTCAEDLAAVDAIEAELTERGESW